MIVNKIVLGSAFCPYDQIPDIMDLWGKSPGKWIYFGS
jgi:hypothetical protein